MLDVKRSLLALKDSKKATFFPRFFKTGKGEYGEGDIFIGVTVPQVRTVALQFQDVSFKEIQRLLTDPIHEVRLAALLILVHRYEHADDRTKKIIVAFYLSNLDRVNSWDLVDLSAYKILGDFLLTRNRSILQRLAKSKQLWHERVAMVSTYAFIRVGQYEETLKLAEMFADHRHDLMHKATGWMLREVGKRDATVLRKFLTQHSHHMPRTMLRYAIEKFSDAERKIWLSKKAPYAFSEVAVRPRA